MSINLIRQKLIVVVLVLLAFVGQTVASTAVPCHDMKAMDMSQQMIMNHTMESTAMASENTAVLDCCQQDCNCPIGLSVSATLTSLFFVEHLNISSQKIEQYTNLLLNKILTSLYRPPIL